MDETEQLKVDLIPYLKLREAEEILHINKYSEKKILWIDELAKYHDPDAIPKKFFQITEKNYGIFQGGKKKYYEYNEIEIVTNYRVFFMGLNLNYLKEDGITPISEIFHLDNFLIWVNNEDIEEVDIECGEGLWKGISICFNFYHDEGDKVKLFPMRIVCSDYSGYLKLKETLIYPLGLNPTKIKFQEQQRMHAIRRFNGQFNFYGTILLVVFGVFLFTKMIDEDISFNMNYIDFGLYCVYVVFFISFNYYWNRTLKKDKETFFSFANMDFTWFKGPLVNFLVFVLCGIIIFGDMGYSLIITNQILSLLASIGSLAVLMGLSMLIGTIVEKSKKKKSNSEKE